MQVLIRGIPAFASAGRFALNRTGRKTMATAPAPFTAPKRDEQGKIDIDELFSKPSWSVESLLPPETPNAITPDVSREQLHHLLRLSALPLPSSPEEESEMLQTLASQLYFVREIQKVDTQGVEPLVSLRDETAEGEKEGELGLEQMKEALAKEEVRGKLHRRVKRKQVDIKHEEWNVLGNASRSAGRYFVVEGGKGRTVP